MIYVTESVSPVGSIDLEKIGKGGDRVSTFQWPLTPQKSGEFQDSANVAE